MELVSAGSKDPFNEHYHAISGKTCPEVEPPGTEYIIKVTNHGGICWSLNMKLTGRTLDTKLHYTVDKPDIMDYDRGKMVVRFMQH